MSNQPVADPVVGIYWRYIDSSIGRLVQVAQTVDAVGLIWQPPAPETNSIYALAMHTLGNAEENILETLCGRSVQRQRDQEFAPTGTAANVQERWDTLRVLLIAALAGLQPGELERSRHHPRRGTITGLEVLLVVARHAAEHLGQAELTRDLWLARRVR